MIYFCKFTLLVVIKLVIFLVGGISFVVIF